MKIYTKKGDAGRTGLFDGTQVHKDDPRIETYGTVDELNSHLGLAIAATTHERLRAILTTLQNQLFVLGGDLATPLGGKAAGKIPRVEPDLIAFLETQIDAATAELPPLKRFILPGGSPAASHLHVARTVCRRAERLLASLMKLQEMGPTPLIYLNRLSDLLFTLARLANKLDGVPDVEWNM